MNAHANPNTASFRNAKPSTPSAQSSSSAPSPSKLTERAMLASLTIRTWSARKHDKRVTRDVASREHAAQDAGRYNKRLMPREALKFLGSQASSARTEHYKRTLPWMDDGARILSAAGYFDYANAIRSLKDDFERAADDFASRYPDFVKAAQTELGNMFDPNDYPDANVIRSKFAIELHTFPMPDPNDFRVSLPSEELELVRADIETQVRNSILSGQREVYGRISEAMTHMVTKLRAYQPDADDLKARGIFRDSLVENVKELATLLPSLNITNDPALRVLAEELKAVAAFPAETLRNSDSARLSTADEAQAILDKVTAFLA